MAERSYSEKVERARYILRLLNGRIERVRARKAGASLNGDRLADLRDRRPVPPPDPIPTTTPGSLECWCLTVQCLLAEIGQKDAAVMVFRLLPRTKSSEASWATVAERTDMTPDRCRQIFRFAVERFDAAMDRYGITEEYKSECAA